MEWLQPLAGGDKVNAWLQSCTAPRPPKLLQVDWEGAPKNRKMVAAVLPLYGNPSCLRSQQIELPFELEDSEILVEVHAAAVNPLDIKMRKGLAHKEAPLSLPSVLGMDFSGVIRKVGSGVEGFSKGDTVFGRQALDRLVQGRNGTYAEWCVVRAADVVGKPRNLTHEQAAAVPTSALVAWSALKLGLPEEKEGAKVIIIGSSGGVGTFAVQMAKRHYDATVVACCSSKHKKMVKKIGADEVIDYTADDWKVDAARLKNFDVVIDCVGLDEYWEVFGRQVLGSTGRYVALNSLRSSALDTEPKKETLQEQQNRLNEGTNTGEDSLSYLERQAKERLLSAKSGVLNLGGSFFTGFRLLNMGKDVRSTDLADIADLLQDGAIKPVINQVHDLRDADKAHEAAETEHVGGKIVLRVRKPWERESVQNIELDNKPEAGFVPKASVEVSPQPFSPSAKPYSSARSNASTEKSSPISPSRPSAVTPNSASPNAAAAALPPGWEFAHDPEGVIYYYSHSLGISQYEHPGINLLPSASPRSLEHEMGGVGLREKENHKLSSLPAVGEEEELPARAMQNPRALVNSADTAGHQGAKGKSTSDGNSKGTKCGLGVTLKLNSDKDYYVKRMERGGPAEMSRQVKAGDILVAVDGIFVKGIEYKELANLVLGVKGSYVELMLRADNSDIVDKVTLQRFPIDPKVLEENERQLQIKLAQKTAMEGGSISRSEVGGPVEAVIGDQGTSARRIGEPSIVDVKQPLPEHSQHPQVDPSAVLLQYRNLQDQSGPAYSPPQFHSPPHNHSSSQRVHPAQNTHVPHQRENTQVPAHQPVGDHENSSHGGSPPEGVIHQSGGSFKKSPVVLNVAKVQPADERQKLVNNVRNSYVGILDPAMELPSTQQDSQQHPGMEAPMYSSVQKGAAMPLSTASNPSWMEIPPMSKTSQPPIRGQGLSEFNNSFYNPNQLASSLASDQEMLAIQQIQQQEFERMQAQQQQLLWEQQQQQQQLQPDMHKPQDDIQDLAEHQRRQEMQALQALQAQQEMETDKKRREQQLAMKERIGKVLPVESVLSEQARQFRMEQEQDFMRQHSSRANSESGSSAGPQAPPRAPAGEPTKNAARLTSMFEVDGAMSTQQILEQARAAQAQREAAAGSTPAQPSMPQPSMPQAPPRPTAGEATKNAARLTSMFEVDGAMSAQQILEQARAAQAQREAAAANAQTQEAQVHTQAQPPAPAAPVGGKTPSDKSRKNAARLTTLFNVDQAMYGQPQAHNLQNMEMQDPRMAAFLKDHGTG